MEIVVDTNHDITQLFKTITNKIKTIDEKAICIIDNYIIIKFEKVTIKKTIASIIAEFIIREFEHEIALSYIKPFEILKTDSEEILNLLSNDEILLEKRKNLIKREIFSTLPGRHINIDGMIKFRLLDYKKELQFTIELLIDELMAKKSYDEFIDLMKYFTDVQTPVTETVILSEQDGEYILTDASGSPINLKFDEEFADELLPFNFSDEDLLISNLMAAMPEKIILNNVNTDKQIINTISRIFEGRIMD